RLPFEADSTAALMYKHLQDDPTPIQNIRPNLPMQTMMVLGRAMAKNPDDRWPTCTAFAEALRQSAGTAGPELTNPFINTPMGMEKPPTVAKPATVAHRPVSRPMRSSELANLPQTGSGANARRTGSGENLELSNYMIPNNQPIPLPPDRSRVIIGGLVGLALVVVFIIIGAMLGVGGGDENATATAVAVAAQPTNSPQPSATLTASLSPRQVALATRAVEQTLNAEFTQIAQLELTETAAMFTATPTATHTPTATDTPTRMPTNTSAPPTDQPSATPVPPTLTPTETPLPPSATPVPPTATLTETPLPPSATPAPTETPVPPTATPTDLPSATPAPTDVPPPTAVPVSMIATDTLPRLFEQDFSAQAEGLVLRVGNPWEVVDVGGDRAYCNTNSDPAASNADIVYWGDAAWDNYVVQARIRFDAPTTVAELYGRYDTRSTLFSAYLNAPNQVANLGYFTPDGGQGLGAKATPLTPGQWYTVRLELDGATVRYWLDGALMVESTDSARPLTPGYAAVRVASGQRVCIDDITVWGFSAAPVVVNPTAEPVSDVAAPGTVSRAATSDLALLFEQDFTGNATTGFSITQGNPWDTILIQGDTAYCNRANPSATDGAADILTFGSTAWEDYIVELDVFFADVTAVEVYTRYNSPNRLYSAFLHGGNQNAVLAYFDPQVETPVLGAQPYNFARNQRYTVRIELVGDSVRYWLGDQLMVEDSSIDRWGAGGAAVRVPSRSRICVDNVRAWSYTEPTGAFYATLVASSANLRTGPGTSFASAGALVRGDRVIVVARNGSSEWLRVRTPYGVEAWLAASLVDFEGSLNTLPVQ
nr:SH3 domain-containing protein [Anaerolineae bacterium]